MTFFVLKENIYCFMKRLDQGHLQPKFKLEVPRLTCPSQESNPDLHGGRPSL